jgi:hypothetical protein
LLYVVAAEAEVSLQFQQLLQTQELVALMEEMDQAQ